MGEVDLPRSCGAFTRLLLNFTWWVNRKDPTGHNVFEGGFLGLDNIGVFDRSAALPTGGTPRAGRRHGLDGAVQPEHARAGAGPGRADDPTTRTSCSSSSSTSSGSPPPSTRSATTPTRCGTRRTASSTTSCACPTAPASGSRCARWSACCRSARPRSSRPISSSSIRRSPPRWPRYLERNHDLLGQHRRPARARRARPAAAVPGQRGQAAPHPGPDARRGPLPRPARHPVDLALAPRRPLRVRRGRRRSRGAVRAGRVDQRDVRRQLQLARAGVVPDQPAAHPGAAAALPVLRRQPHDRVPDRLGRRDDAVRGGQGAVPPPRRHVPARRGRAAARSTAGPSCSRRTRTGGTSSCSTSTSTATTAPGSAPRTRPGGPAWWPG